MRQLKEFPRILPRVWSNIKLLLCLILLLLTLWNLYLSSFSVRYGEVTFFSDIARDFLLLQELNEKKIILIGPRSNTNGLFHGPVWTYINYPAYLLGNGNPVTVAWFWVFLGGIFLLTSFFIAKKLFGMFPALAYILLLSTRLVPHINGVFHSEATFFFMPIFFFSIAMYVESKKKLYLAIHLVTSTILIQLNIGLGILFFMLSALIIFWFIFKNKLWKHLFIFSLIPLFLSNFIVFDLRNGLRMTKAIFAHSVSSKFFIPFRSWLENRIDNTLHLQLLENTIGNLTILHIIFVLIVFFTIVQIKNKSKHRHLYVLPLFYYFGYMFLSIFNKGILLYHYVHLLIPLTTLWFVSFLESKYKLLFLPFIGIIFYLNFNYANGYNGSRNLLIGNDYVSTDYNSWRSLSAVAKEVINRQKGEEFGYFVFAPDAFAYQPRYAMIYHFKTAHAKAFEYVKKPITYIIAAPPPANDPYMTHVWWRKVPVKISSEPAETKKFPNGFTIERFNLSEEEQRVPHDKTIEVGIHFR